MLLHVETILNPKKERRRELKKRFCFCFFAPHQNHTNPHVLFTQQKCKRKQNKSKKIICTRIKVSLISHTRTTQQPTQTEWIFCKKEMLQICNFSWARVLLACPFFPFFDFSLVYLVYSALFFFFFCLVYSCCKAL